MDAIYDSDDSDDEPPALVNIVSSNAPPLIDDDNMNVDATELLNPSDAAVDAADSHSPPVAVSMDNTGTGATNSSSSPVIGPPCPVTILSGFLGSGKTTLIQYILRDPNHGKRIAVIENEFGDGLAVESLIARDGETNNSLQDLIELPNGCICCTVKDNLVATLENLIDKAQNLDYIIIESSGMANPGPIASVFWLDEALESRLRLDGIVTLVDSHNILHQLETTEEAAQQIAYADRILLNKMDLLESNKNDINTDNLTISNTDRIDRVKSTIHRINPSAPYQCTKYSQIPDLDWILGANCFGGSKRVDELDEMWNQVQAQQNQQDGASHDHDRSHDHSHSHDHGDDDCEHCQSSTLAQKPKLSTGHTHTSAVVTVAFDHQGSICLTKLNQWLADILWPNQDETDKVLTAMLHNSQQQQEQNQDQQDGTNTSDESKPKPAANSHNSNSNMGQTEQQIFRIKGIASVHIENLEEHILDENELEANQRYYNTTTKLDQRRYIVQAVHDLWEVHPGSDNLIWSPEEERVCKVVIIGKHLNSNQLREGFLSCFV